MDIQQDKIIKIITMFYPSARIYLFGSSATQTYDERSDIDIAIDNKSPIALEDKWKILAMIEALNMSQTVDIVDFTIVPQSLQDTIIKQGVVWKE